MRSSTFRVTLRPRRGFAPEEARDARARAWAYIFERAGKHRNAAESSGENGPKGNKDDRTARGIVPQRS
jgi:hypothetical protein